MGLYKKRNSPRDRNVTAMKEVNRELVNGYIILYSDSTVTTLALFMEEWRNLERSSHQWLARQ